MLSKIDLLLFISKSKQDWLGPVSMNAQGNLHLVKIEQSFF